MIQPRVSMVESFRAPSTMVNGLTHTTQDPLAQWEQLRTV
jgi:hypothetical protein